MFSSRFTMEIETLLMFRVLYDNRVVETDLPQQQTLDCFQKHDWKDICIHTLVSPSLSLVSKNNREETFINGSNLDQMLRLRLDSGYYSVYLAHSVLSVSVFLTQWEQRKCQPEIKYSESMNDFNPVGVRNQERKGETKADHLQTDVNIMLLKW